MRPSKRLLLSSVCKPFGDKYGDSFSTQTVFSYQNCWVQGPFLIEKTMQHWGLDVIASNLDIPSTVLQYPSMSRFVSELRRHHYDYVGLSFNEPTLHKVRPMVAAVRKHSPRSEIILGGYGTALGDETIGHLADHICRGEGIGFMRRLLGEPERPFNHPVITAKTRLFSLPVLGETGLVSAGLGCPNGCDFCMTSHYFDRKHIRYLDTGKDIVDVLQKIRAEKPGLTSFWICDEDLLMNRRRGREFLEAMRQSDLVLNIVVFGSMKSLSFYEVSELAEMGVSSIWVGFEGLRAGYAKMKSDRSYAQLAEECRRYGIQLVMSMIIGFDYQTPEIIRDELREFMRLKPTMPQFLIHSPSAGTPLWHKLKEEGRLNRLYDDTSLRDGFSLMFEHPHISADEMRALLMECYRTEYEVNGPSIFRAIETDLTTYEHLRDSSNPKLRARAAQRRAALERSWGAYRAGLVHAPNEQIRRQVRELYARIERSVGRPNLRTSLLSYAAVLAASWTNVRRRSSHLMQPRTQSRAYNWDS